MRYSIHLMIPIFVLLEETRIFVKILVKLASLEANSEFSSWPDHCPLFPRDASQRSKELTPAKTSAAI